MLNQIVNFIVKYLKSDDPVNGSKYVGGDVKGGQIQELKTQNSNMLLVSVINIEEEYALKNQALYSRKMGALVREEPYVYLNVYLLFAATHSTYDTALMRLSEVIQFFQHKYHFRPFDTYPQNISYPTEIEKLSFELYSLKLEQLNHLWGILGGIYYPSVLYKVRIAKIRKEGYEQEGPEVNKIKLGADIL